MTGTGRVPRRLGRRQADLLVTTVIDRLAATGVLPADARFDPAAFHALRDRVRATFHVPETSVTPVMARLLFALGAAQQPRRILVVGAYCGNTLVWLAGHALAAPGAGGVVTAVGCDVDVDACEVAQANVDRLDAGETIQIVAGDGHQLLASSPTPWDLVLLDADDPVRRKAIYASLLDEAVPILRTGSLVLAHDTALELFADDLQPYFDRVADRSRYTTVHLPIDECGLSVSLVKSSEGAAP